MGDTEKGKWEESTTEICRKELARYRNEGKIACERKIIL